MGFFTKDELGASGSGMLAPLTVDAVKAVLDSWEANYAIDPDGDPGGYWDGHLFFFMRNGTDQSVLSIRGRWMRELGGEHRDEVLSLLNAWHAEKIWPKGYVQEEEKGLGIYAEMSTTLESGVTGAQLGDLMGCAIGTSIQLFEHLDEHFPEAAEAAKQDDN
jgi:Putative bacterial sensory transduction regulator